MKLIFSFKSVSLLFLFLLLTGCSELNNLPAPSVNNQIQQSEQKRINNKGNYSLIVYKSSDIKGYKNKPIIIDYYFVPIMRRINAYAQKYNLMLYVTSSFRTQEEQKHLTGTVVAPASMSNHLAGHAIDVNIEYNGKWYSSTSLNRKNFNSLPNNIKGFIYSLRSDKNIRWGGDFNPEDPVHIDDQLNKNKNEWYNRFYVCQEAFKKSKM